MIVEIIYGKTLPAGSQGNRGEFPDSSLRMVGGDLNLALYRAMGLKQESMDIRGGVYQRALICAILRHNTFQPTACVC